MKVLIDGHMIGHRETGNERYTRCLFESLLQFESGTFKPMLLVSRRIPGLRNTIISGSGDAARLLYSINRIVGKYGIDIVHSNYIGPIIKRSKSVITLHDLSFRRFPELYGWKDWLIFNKLLPRSLSMADAVIVPTDFTMAETKRYFPEIADKTFVTREAAGEIFGMIHRVTARKSAVSKWGLGNFVLALNSRNRKKNMNRLVEAFVRSGLAKLGYVLAVVGGAHNIRPDFRTEAWLKVIDYVSDRELNIMYNACNAFVYYSYYEGFGLPILEALECGALVIASDIPPHREIAEKRVTYVDPYNPVDLAEVLSGLPTKKSHTRLIKHNTGTGKGLSWEMTAKKTIGIYKLVYRK